MAILEAKIANTIIGMTFGQLREFSKSLGGMMLSEDEDDTIDAAIDSDKMAVALHNWAEANTTLND